MPTAPLYDVWMELNGLVADAEARGMRADLVASMLLKQGVARLVLAQGRDGAEHALAEAIPQVRAGDYDTPLVNRLPLVSFEIH